MTAGAILLIAETLLPTFGILGILGVLCVLGSVTACFWVNQWLGVAMLVTLAIASPLLFSLAMRLWPHTPVGKRLILNHAESAPPKPVFSLGQVGTAMTEMHPSANASLTANGSKRCPNWASFPPAQR